MLRGSRWGRGVFAESMGMFAAKPKLGLESARARLMQLELVHFSRKMPGANRDFGGKACPHLGGRICRESILELISSN
jgi:hypothetical protein